jgi:DNA-binding NarL/FixJ family response regulator
MDGPFLPIKILLVDDRAVVRHALAIFIEVCDDLMVVGEASNGEEAITLCADLQPDVVLMDLFMPIMDGAKATQHIRQQFPHIQVLILTSDSYSEQAVAALNFGAFSVLQKSVSIDVLAEAIRRAAVHGSQSQLEQDDGQRSDFDALYAQWLGCIEKRGELYRQLERLRKREMTVVMALSHEYSLYGNCSSISTADALASFRSIRSQHRTIFAELNIIHSEAERIKHEMLAARPKLSVTPALYSAKWFDD